MTPRRLLLLFAVFMVCELAPAFAQDGVSPLSDAACRAMRTSNVLSPNPHVGCGRLAVVSFGFVGFDGRHHDDGQLIVLDAVAPSVLAIMQALKERGFPMQSARPMEDFAGSDDASMDANNTSAFNDRLVEGSTSISLHALGCAIDINPVQNPYITRSGAKILVEPRAGSPYASRNPSRPGMAEAIIRIFAQHGFDVWGGRWRQPDYQHFTIDRALAQRLVSLDAARAKAVFADHVKRTRLRP